MSKNNDGENWDLVIRSRNSWFDLQLKEVWRYKDLITLFIKRDFSSQYKQTVLGPVWHLVQPILTTAIFLLIFGKIANIPTDGIKPVLFYMSGITLWNYFSACLTSTSNTFVAQCSHFRKSIFSSVGYSDLRCAFKYHYVWESSLALLTGCHDLVSF